MAVYRLTIGASVETHGESQELDQEAVRYALIDELDGFEFWPAGNPDGLALWDVEVSAERQPDGTGTVQLMRELAALDVPEVVADGEAARTLQRLAGRARELFAK